MQLSIDPLDLRELRAAARARGTTPSELVMLIVEYAVRDNLIAAILDDEPRTKKPCDDEQRS